MTNLEVERFHSACADIQREAKHTKALNYAVGYAAAGGSLRDEEAIKVQCLYILNNITHWRGPVAKAARATFKELAK